MNILAYEKAILFPMAHLNLKIMEQVKGEVSMGEDEVGKE
jgi:hypothetical protein